MNRESALPLWVDLLLLVVLVVGLLSLWFHRRDTDQHSWLIAWLIGENRRLARQVRLLSMKTNLPFDPKPEEPLVPRSHWRMAWDRFSHWVRHLTVPENDQAEDDYSNRDKPEDIPTAPEMPAQVREALGTLSPADDPEWRRRFGLD